MQTVLEMEIAPSRFANQARMAVRNAKSARVTYLRSAAAQLFSRIKMDTARMLALRPRTAPRL